ncbi:hypothetical protein FOMPIDRAFT_1017352 [Fomitopsis schrenkii]|uniref:Uncharacterized protein n=1 Tax=Fomitopsis schrenkii TaxID=2126942 RepID=S8E6M7_FOMSC|nr:hypothetical protein FOMPIDRAFT_1017352 [Fomitopsis schrenkii]
MLSDFEFHFSDYLSEHLHAGPSMEPTVWNPAFTMEPGQLSVSALDDLTEEINDLIEQQQLLYATFEQFPVEVDGVGEEACVATANEVVEDEVSPPPTSSTMTRASTPSPSHKPLPGLQAGPVVPAAPLSASASASATSSGICILGLGDGCTSSTDSASPTVPSSSGLSSASASATDSSSSSATGTDSVSASATDSASATSSSASSTGICILGIGDGCSSSIASSDAHVYISPSDPSRRSKRLRTKGPVDYTGQEDDDEDAEERPTKRRKPLSEVQEETESHGARATAQSSSKGKQPAARRGEKKVKENIAPRKALWHCEPCDMDMVDDDKTRQRHLASRGHKKALGDDPPKTGDAVVKCHLCGKVWDAVVRHQKTNCPGRVVSPPTSPSDDLSSSAESILCYIVYCRIIISIYFARPHRSTSWFLDRFHLMINRLIAMGDCAVPHSALTRQKQPVRPFRGTTVVYGAGASHDDYSARDSQSPPLKPAASGNELPLWGCFAKDGHDAARGMGKLFASQAVTSHSRLTLYFHDCSAQGYRRKSYWLSLRRLGRLLESRRGFMVDANGVNQQCLRSPLLTAVAVKERSAP